MFCDAALEQVVQAFGKHLDRVRRDGRRRDEHRPDLSWFLCKHPLKRPLDRLRLQAAGGKQNIQGAKTPFVFLSAERPLAAFT